MIGRRMSWLTWRRTRQLLVLAVALTVLAIGGWFGGRQALAWHRLRLAEQDLQRNQPRRARQRLDFCLRIHPNDPTAHLLAARAARKSGDLDAAASHLLACQRLEREPSEDSVLEFALLRAASGDVDEVDAYLHLQARKRPDRKPSILEALAFGFLRLYRFNEAMGCLEQWLKIEPESVAALVLRGKAWKRVHAYHNAVADFEHALQLDPDQFDARLDLSTIHIDNGHAADAVTHLEYLRRQDAANPEVLVRLAAAFTDHGDYAEAQRVLDQLLRDHPHFAVALSAQGQLCLATNRFAEAESWLRQAMTENPFDRQSHYRLYIALQRQQKESEATEQEQRLKQIDRKIERLIELSNRKLPNSPHDPALLFELGQIISDLGQEEVGVQWYHTALRKDPKFAPAHRALAEYLERKGDREGAAFHRSAAGSSSPTEPGGNR